MTIHAERRVIHHRPQDLYQLVANVRAYPEFLPWCLAARIRHETDHELEADLIIGFNMFRERFTSHVKLDPDALEINVAYAEGPFKYLRNQWVFHPHPDGCEIEFYVDFEFNSRLLQSVIETLCSPRRSNAWYGRLKHGRMRCTARLVAKLSVNH